MNTPAWTTAHLYPYLYLPPLTHLCVITYLYLLTCVGSLDAKVTKNSPVPLMTTQNSHTCLSHQLIHLLFQPSTSKIKEQTSLETDPNEQASSVREILPNDPAGQESLAMDSLASESQQESQSAALEAGTEA